MPSRPWHVIAPTKRSTLPERIICLAVEPAVSRPMAGVQEHTYGCGYAEAVYYSAGSVSDRIGRHFRCAAALWEFIDVHRSTRSCTWIFAHNLGYVLTLLGFWDTLDAGCDTLVSAVISDPPTIITTRRQGRLIRYVDSQNYWRDNGLAMDRADHQCYQSLRKTGGPSREIGQICQRRVECTLGRILGLVGALGSSGAGSWAATAASIAWNVYRHSFMNADIQVHGNEPCIQLERAALFGGRLEARKSGWVPDETTSIDCNSLYPAVMADYQWPCKLIAYTESPSKRMLHEGLRGHYCLADVSMAGSHPAIPTRILGATAWSMGACRSVLAHHELLACQQACAIARVHALAVYETADLFSQYVGYCYPRKLAAREMGDDVGESFYKLLLNSLAGKFAQKGRTWHDDQEIIAPDRYCEWWHYSHDSVRPIRCRAIAGHTQAMREGPEPRHTSPVITAGICAAGRVKLQGCIASAGESEVHYCDTDSLHCSTVGWSRLSRAGLISPTQRGLWRVQCRGADAYYWGAKHYRIGDWWCCNYLPCSAREVAHGTYLVDAQLGLARRLGSGVIDRVLVPERTIQMPPGMWDQRTRMHHQSQEHHGHTESHTQIRDTSSSLSPLW